MNEQDEVLIIRIKFSFFSLTQIHSLLSVVFIAESFLDDYLYQAERFNNSLDFPICPYKRGQRCVIKNAEERQKEKIYELIKISLRINRKCLVGVTKSQCLTRRRKIN
jgi:hypothetical protein